MPRPEYYNLRRTNQRTQKVHALAEVLGLDASQPATWAVVFDIALGMALKQFGENKEKENGDDT